MPPSALRFFLAVVAMGGSLALTRCGNGESTTTSTGTSCQDGICGPGSSGTGGTTASSGATGGNSTTGGGMTSGSTSSGMGSSTSSGGTCTPQWVCTPWDTGVQPAGQSNAGTRTCTDKMNCNNPAGKPATTATLPHLDVNYFECKVEPILDKKCGMLGCHGTETGRALRVYARARLRHAGETLSDPANCGGSASSASCTAGNSCPCGAKHTATEWQRNYDAARGFALDAMGTPIADEHTSDLIQQPVVGGKSHAGIHLFTSTDPEDATIYSWLTGATLPSNTCIGIN